MTQPMFVVLATVALISALGVVASRSPVHSALWLVLNLFTIAGFYAHIDAHFLMAAQIIVYAGAIMILVLFVIMLLGLAPSSGGRVSVRGVVGVLAVVGLVGVFAPSIMDEGFARYRTVAADGNEGGRQVRTSVSAMIPGDTRSIGRVLYTRYVFPFEAASILIIGAMAGAVLLARRRRREDGAH